MTPNVHVGSTYSLLAVDPAATTAATQKEFRKRATASNLASEIRASVCHATILFEGFAGILAVFYLSVVAALSGLLLFYTFNR